VLNIFRFAPIAKYFFVRDDRAADGWRTLFGFSFFRPVATRERRLPVCWSGGVFLDISTGNVLKIAFSDDLDIAPTDHERIIQSWFIASHIAQSTPFAGA